MLQRIRKFMDQYNMLDKGDRIVIGVSGGADSICLLSVLIEMSKDYDTKLFVVHINHGLRGEEADRDEQFVMELCKSLGIEYDSFYYDVEDIAKREGLSSEEAGRQVRYQAFYNICRQKQCNKLAIAHNKNDNAETVLFHLFRGSGIKGLSGIEPVRAVHMEDMDITLIRPLLCIERVEIEEYLSNRGLEYKIDSTNLINEYSRNKIRNQIIRYASQEINTNAIHNINEAALHLRETNYFVEECVGKSYQAVVHHKEQASSFLVEEILKENIVIQKGIVKRVLVEMAGYSKDLESKHINQVLSLCLKPVGKMLNLPYQMIAYRDYDEIRIFCDSKSKHEEEAGSGFEPMELTIPSRIAIPKTTLTLDISVIAYEKNMEIPKNSCTKWFDYDKIENTVVVRSRNMGDYIQINRLGGRKKLKDYFIDQKIPRQDRENKLLIADGNHIMWILGDENRISEYYKVDENTRHILLMKAEEDKNV